MELEGKKAELLELWQKYGEEYRTLIPTYHALLSRWKELKSQKWIHNNIPQDGLTKAAIADYPEISVLKIENEEKALWYVIVLSDDKVASAIRDIKNYVELNSTYRAAKICIERWKRQISAAEACKKSGERPRMSYHLASCPAFLNISRVAAVPARRVLE
ncbi:hypothetical protein IKF34_02130 [Candidatus Saccharibacteria bacterium]|nr:hypothetical protein [Candidatus Saccharibacteria bacterium]